MEGPGRKSLAALSVVTTIPGQRPEPPEELTDRQKDLWRSIVATKPPEWWGADSIPLLIAYCRSIETHEYLSARVDRIQARKTMGKKAFGEYRELLKAQEKQARLMTTLATKMRLSQQSRYTENRAATADRKTASEAAKPWEFGKSA